MPLSTFEDVLLRLSPPRLLLFFAELDIKAIVSLSKTSSALHSAYIFYAKQTWEPTKHFASWFEHPAAFRRLLARTNSVISGSFALQFFDRIYYPTSDMDIYLRVAGADEVCRWLTRQDYTYVQGNKTYPHVISRDRVHIDKAVRNMSSSLSPLLAVYNFERKIKLSTSETIVRHVQVIVVDTDPIEHILFDFHSTVVMNFITAERAVSIFPRSTFIDRLSYTSKVQEKALIEKPKWRIKYERRGFTFRDDTDSYSAVRNLICQTSILRSVQDKFSWQIPFPNEQTWNALPPPYGTLKIDYDFEVLVKDRNVVAKGCCIKVAEPYVWRFVALIIQRIIY
ncbi:hypothetical protein CVT26_009861 [Gymnopilus dilepis]|uniref:Uncharacterized protein n=1 Tax=Gymnopilus dilepis TaxID=231916 RepID=A0A409YC48_9AGAR|nr:hypothetical protein CVT26_009861 [Gymnopilus dilepis]